MSHIHFKDFHYKKEAEEFSIALKKEPMYDLKVVRYVKLFKKEKFWRVEWWGFAWDLCYTCRVEGRPL